MASFHSQPDHYDVIKNTEDPIVTWESLTYYEGALRARLDLKTDVTVTEALAARVTKNENDIADLDRRKEEKSDADIVRQRVTNLEETKADKTELEKTNHHIQDVDNRMTSAEGNINNLQAADTSLRNSITTETGNLHDEIEGLRTDYTSLRGNVTTLSEHFATLNAFTGTVNHLDSDFTDLRNRLNKLTDGAGSGSGNDFVTSAQLAQTLANYALKSALNSYVTSSQLSAYITKTDADGRYVLKTAYDDKIDELETLIRALTGSDKEIDLSNYLTKKTADTTYLKKTDLNAKVQAYLENANTGKKLLFELLDPRYLKTADFEDKLIAELKKKAVRDELDAYLKAKQGKDALHEALDAWYLKISDFNTKIKEYLDDKKYLTETSADKLFLTQEEADKLYAKIGSGGGGTSGGLTQSQADQRYLLKSDYTPCNCASEWAAIKARVKALEDKHSISPGPVGGEVTIEIDISGTNTNGSWDKYMNLEVVGLESTKTYSGTPGGSTTLVDGKGTLTVKVDNLSSQVYVGFKQAWDNAQNKADIPILSAKANSVGSPKVTKIPALALRFTYDTYVGSMPQLFMIGVAMASSGIDEGNRYPDGTVAYGSKFEFQFMVRDTVYWPQVFPGYVMASTKHTFDQGELVFGSDGVRRGGQLGDVYDVKASQCGEFNKSLVAIGGGLGG